MMDDLQIFLWNFLCEMSGEEVARVLTYYHGNQLLDAGFLEWLQDNGYIEEDVVI